MTVLALATGAHAGVTNVAWYRLGENDPGGASGVTATNTANLLGFTPLKPIGTPRYTNAVSPTAANGLASSLAVHFSGTNQFLTNALVSTAVNNFGIEAWVKPNTTNAGSYFIAQNGFLYHGGWAIVQGGNGYYGFMEASPLNFGVGGGTPGLASPGVWAHVALVRNNGTNRFYVNGAADGPATTDAPLQPFGQFTIGANFTTNFVGPGTVMSNSFYNGTIDEVRVFTFAPGQFSTNDLLFFAQRAATLPATAVNPPNATLNGSASSVGFPISAWFEFGTTTNYGSVTPAQLFGSGVSTTNFSQVLNGIDAGVTYHFRAVASNNLGLAFGTNQSFTRPLFTNIGVGLVRVHHSAAAWGDLNNDGRLDIALTGVDRFGFQPILFELWTNTGSTFVRLSQLSGTYSGSVAWGDADNDGDLDLLLTGIAATFPPLLEVLRNRGFGFFDIVHSRPYYARAAIWGDFDAAGWLDFMSSAPELQQNTGGGFGPVDAGLQGSANAPLASGDFDNDGDLDILLNGKQVWRNTGGRFTNINAGLPDVFNGSADWGDFDNDGWLDLLLTGQLGETQLVAQVWRNIGSGFTNINAGLPGVSFSSVAWGDYDNDGRLDILLTGTTNALDFNGRNASGGIAQVWRNTSNGFTNIDAGLPGVAFGAGTWGDYDNDGRLDILLCGSNHVADSIAQIWRNNTGVTNTPPSAPSGLSLTHTASGTVTLSWNLASDAQTPANGLSYNVRIGTTPGGIDVVSPMSFANGLRLLPQHGNARTRLTFRPVPGTTYYWSVQAVDTAFAGSAFSSEASFAFHGALGPAGSTSLVPGDLNGDGVVDEAELNIVLANYFPYSPFLQMTNVAGLGGTNVTFALTNSLAGAFSVEYTTNLLDWLFLGPATPRYLFTDTNAPAQPQRYYRLRWP